MFSITIILSLAIISPYLITILTSFVLAYIFHPLYVRLNKKIDKKNLSALIISALIILLLVVPAIFIIYQISQEANVGYITLKQTLSKKGFFGESCTGYFCDFIESVKHMADVPEARYYIENGFQKISDSIGESTLGFVFSLPSRLLEIFLTFFFTFYLLRDGKKMISNIEKKVPLKKSYKKRIFRQVHETIHAIIYGFFVIAVAEGAIGAFVFWLFGVPSPILWGLAIAFLAFVPFIGGTLVYIPAALFKFADSQIFSGIGILAGGMIISYIDTFIRPKVIGNKAAIHPAIILLGLLGGLKLIGFAGLLIGPIILSLLLMFIERFTNKNSN